MTDLSGFLLIFSGPSGSGKDTVINELLQRDDKTVVSISMTTRKPRPGEIQGQSYYFVSHEEFEKKIENNEMLEWAKYGDNYYGTPKAPVSKWISEGKTVILEIEVQGADKLRARYPGVRTLFLMPPSMHVLEKRLSSRMTETPEQIRMRLDVAKKEIGRASDYDYIVVNNILEDTVDDVLELILRHRRHLRHDSKSVEERVNELDEFYYGHQFKRNFRFELND